MAQDRLTQIARELSRLFDQQIKTISKSNLLEMTEDEFCDYESRRTRIDQLRVELAGFQQVN